MKLGMRTEIVKLTLAVNSDRDHIQGPTSAVATLIEAVPVQPKLLVTVTV